MPASVQECESLAWPDPIYETVTRTNRNNAQMPKAPTSPQIPVSTFGEAEAPRFLRLKPTSQLRPTKRRLALFLRAGEGGESAHRRASSAADTGSARPPPKLAKAASWSLLRGRSEMAAGPGSRLQSPTGGRVERLGCYKKPEIGARSGFYF